MVRAAVAALSVALAWQCANAVAEQRGGSSAASAHVDLQIRVPAVVRGEAIGQPRTLTIGTEDLARGYVDGSGTVILTSNTGAGYRLAVVFDSRLLSKVRIRLQDRVVEAAEPDTFLQVFAPDMLKSHLQVRYRLYLATDAKRGTYAWPVRLEFAPGA